MDNLNEQSLRLVMNIYNNMSNHYHQYDIFINKNDISGSVSIEVLNQGSPVNKYFFYPDGVFGRIESIAIYGVALQSHYETISRTQNIFGFKIKGIALITHNTMSPFVDIHLESMNI
jgi:hypothetical protein